MNIEHVHEYRITAQLKYTHQMSFIGYLNPNELKVRLNKSKVKALSKMGISSLGNLTPLSGAGDEGCF